MSLLQNRFAQQMVLGTVSGLVTGYCVRTVGRIAAAITGTGIIAYQIAEYNGVVPTDLKKTTQDQSTKLQEKIANNMKEFMKSRQTLTYGFVGGFCLGIAI